MGKVYITDEGDSSYTANVTSNGMLRVDNGGYSFKLLPSAQNVASGIRVFSGAGVLKRVILGSLPGTATRIGLYDSFSAGLEGLTAFTKVSGANWIGRIDLEPSAGALSSQQTLFPRVLDYNVYCTSGLCVSIGLSANDATGRIGNCQGITVIYQPVV